MNRRTADEYDADDDGDDFEPDDDSDESTIACPYCRQEMYEDSPRCPHCGQYISDEDAPPTRKSWWIVVGVLLCLAVVWLWIASL
jgi:hypothetical protein